MRPRPWTREFDGGKLMYSVHKGYGLDGFRGLIKKIPIIGDRQTKDVGADGVLRLTKLWTLVSPSIVLVFC